MGVSIFSCCDNVKAFTSSGLLLNPMKESTTKVLNTDRLKKPKLLKAISLF